MSGWTVSAKPGWRGWLHSLPWRAAARMPSRRTRSIALLVYRAAVVAAGFAILVPLMVLDVLLRICEEAVSPLDRAIDRLGEELRLIDRVRAYRKREVPS